MRVWTSFRQVRRRYGKKASLPSFRQNRSWTVSVSYPLVTGPCLTSTPEGYSHKEISGMLDIEESTSRSQYTRARQMLEDILIRRKLLPEPREKTERRTAIQ